MPSRHVVVDGSNLATEGRSLPNLGQLDQAVRDFIAENPDDRVTVVVDATFAHRIDPSELPVFEEAEAAGEVVSPPAGAVGRGDAFLLRVAEKTGATVLSNDSFQEFHAEHPWLFDPDRLIGGKPVPGVGWVFVTRTPVRGPKSREVTKQARKKKQVAANGPRSDQTGLEMAASKAKDKKVDRAIARATEEVIAPEPAGRRRRRRAGEPPSDPVNEPLAFITFIAAHPLGSEIAGVVEEFSSHGAFVRADGARCYVPLSALGEPPPRRAREVLSKGEERTFVIQALDPPRRGIELALPGFAHIAGVPTAETVEAEIHPTLSDEEPTTARTRRGRGAEKGAATRAAPAKASKPTPAPAAPGRLRKAAAKEDQKAAPEPGVKAPAKKVPAKAAPTRRAAAEKAAAERAAGKAPAKKASAKAAPTRRAPAEKAAAERVAGKVPAKKAPAGKAPAKRVAGGPAPAGKAPAKKVAGGKAPAKTPHAAVGQAAKASAKAPAIAKKVPAKAALGAKKAPGPATSKSGAKKTSGSRTAR